MWAVMRSKVECQKEGESCSGIGWAVWERKREVRAGCRRRAGVGWWGLPFWWPGLPDTASPQCDSLDSPEACGCASSVAIRGLESGRVVGARVVKDSAGACVA